MPFNFYLTYTCLIIVCLSDTKHTRFHIRNSSDDIIHYLQGFEETSCVARIYGATTGCAKWDPDELKRDDNGDC